MNNAIAIPIASTVQGVNVAAIVHADHSIADSLLADFAFSLQRSGRRVRGLVQRFRGGASGKKAALLLDLGDGTTYPLFQNLGSGSVSCSVDENSLAAASVVLRRALGEKPDLVIVNRFGPLEAAGGGFVTEMLALMSDDIPVLTVVQQKHLTAWRHFTGGLAAELEPRREVLDSWFFATREAPFRVGVAEDFTDTREGAWLNRVGGKRSEVVASADYVSFGNTDRTSTLPATTPGGAGGSGHRRGGCPRRAARRRARRHRSAPTGRHVGPLGRRWRVHRSPSGHRAADGVGLRRASRRCRFRRAGSRALR